MKMELELRQGNFVKTGEPYKSVRIGQKFVPTDPKEMVEFSCRVEKTIREALEKEFEDEECPIFGSVVF